MGCLEVSKIWYYLVFTYKSARSGRYFGIVSNSVSYELRLLDSILGFVNTHCVFRLLNQKLGSGLVIV